MADESPIQNDNYTAKSVILVSRNQNEPLPVQLEDGKTIVGNSTTNSGISQVEVPVPDGDDTHFLNGDGAWVVPAGGVSSSRFSWSTQFESITDRYTMLVDNAGSGGLIEVDTQGLSVSAGTDNNDRAGIILLNDNADDIAPISKNVEFTFFARFNGVDTGVSGDNIDFFVGFGPIAPTDFTDNLWGLCLNPVDGVFLKTGNGASGSSMPVAGAAGSDWALYTIAFDGAAVTCKISGTLAATLSTTLPTTVATRFSAGATNRADNGNAGKLQVIAVSWSRDL